MSPQAGSSAGHPVLLTWLWGWHPGHGAQTARAQSRWPPSGPATPVELWEGEAVGAGQPPDPQEPRGASERSTHMGTRGLLPVM